MEPDPIEAAVDDEGDVVDLDDLGQEGHAQREGQGAVGDRGAERAVAAGAVRVDVDPLVVAGDGGERGDPVLVDEVPVAGAELVVAEQVVESGEPWHRPTL